MDATRPKRTEVHDNFTPPRSTGTSAACTFTKFVAASISSERVSLGYCPLCGRLRVVPSTVTADLAGEPAPRAAACITCGDWLERLLCSSSFIRGRG